MHTHNYGVNNVDTQWSKQYRHNNEGNNTDTTMKETTDTKQWTNNVGTQQ